MSTNKKEIVLNVKGMTCGHCEMTVKKSLEKIDGVKKARVNRKKNNAIVIIDSDADVETMDLLKAIARTGYEASLKRE
jgi:copper chaperone CopZ